MSEISESPSNVVTIHQCLFGYDEGHRLLASSTKLTIHAHSTLLLLSDLVPGIKINDANGYWTGVPLRESKQYALMRTWSAPEMPRPGCVWTHAILIRFADIARFVDLGVLRGLFAQPDFPGDYLKYRKTKTVIPTEISESVNISSEKLLKLTRAVYGDSPEIDISLLKPGDYDDALFALWSQQWPRLRRSFSFRTAASNLEGTYPDVKFDLRFIVSADTKLEDSQALISERMPWEILALDDLNSKVPTEFRRFLWRYGSDINHGRERFSLLADIYQKTRTKYLSGHQLDALLLEVTSKIPDLEDGLTLKEDLVACDERKYSLLPAIDSMDVLAFFVRHPKICSLPTPNINVLSTLQKHWNSRAAGIIYLAELATEEISDIGIAILSSLADLAKPGELFELIGQNQSLQKYLIPLHPEILISNEIVHVQKPELSRLLDLIPIERLDIIPELINYLLPLNNAEIAREIIYRFPRETVLVAMEWLKQSIEGIKTDLPLAWRQEIELKRSLLLESGVIENAQSTRFLYEISKILQYDSNEVLKAGPMPWIKALKNANDNVRGEERQTFLGFILALAIHSPIPESELIFEMAFEVVHKDIWNNRFSWEGLNILRRHLPEIGWGGNWDNCKRLRKAIVFSYSDGTLNHNSFYKLTTDRNLWMLLIVTAREIKKGRRLLTNKFI